MATFEAVRQIANELARVPGVRLEASDLGRLLGWEPGRLKGVGSGFGRHVRKHYGRTNAPYHRALVDNKTIYWMDPETAATWRRATT